jgi:hypothetical protein
MRVIIAGSRTIIDYKLIASHIEETAFHIPITSIVSGTARGVDRLGEEWARRNGVKVTRYPANWKQFGRAAGYRRNEEMARNADAAIIIWDGISKGTKHMIKLAKSHNLRTFIYIETGEQP